MRSHRDCAKCNRDIYVRPRYNPYHVSCQICDRFFHVNCIYIDPRELNDVFTNKDWYMCNICKLANFPFQSLDKFEFKRCFYLNDINDFNELLPDLLASDFFQHDNNDNIDEGVPLDIKETKYFTADGMHKKMVHDSNKFSLMHVNLNTLNDKYKMYHSNLCDLLNPMNGKFNIIAVSETRLNELSDLTNLSIPGYKPLSKEYCDFSPTCAGGVAVYIDENLDAFPRPDLKMGIPECENIWLEINQGSSNKNIIFGLVYRHPRKLAADIDIFTQAFELNLEKINHEGKLSFITGDVNLNLLNASGTGIPNYVNALFCNNHTKPTRIVPNKTPSLIDHMYSNALESEIETGICLYPISDGHLPIFAIADIKPSYINRKIFVRNYKKFNTEEFNNHLRFNLADFD